MDIRIVQFLQGVRLVGGVVEGVDGGGDGGKVNFSNLQVSL